MERQNTTGHWLAIGRVAAAGTSAVANTYDFLDADPGPTNPALYRLRQVDYSGDFTYSSIVALARTDGEPAAGIFPNPARDHIFVEGMNSGKFTITDAAGRIVARGHINDAQRFRVDLPATLPAEIYLFYHEQGKTQRFSVAR